MNQLDVRHRLGVHVAHEPDNACSRRRSRGWGSLKPRDIPSFGFRGVQFCGEGVGRELSAFRRWIIARLRVAGPGNWGIGDISEFWGALAEGSRARNFFFESGCNRGVVSVGGETHSNFPALRLRVDTKYASCPGTEGVRGLDALCGSAGGLQQLPQGFTVNILCKSSIKRDTDTFAVLNKSFLKYSHRQWSTQSAVGVVQALVGQKRREQSYSIDVIMPETRRQRDSTVKALILLKSSFLHTFFDLTCPSSCAVLRPSKWISLPGKIIHGSPQARVTQLPHKEFISHSVAPACFFDLPFLLPAYGLNPGLFASSNLQASTSKFHFRYRTRQHSNPELNVILAIQLEKKFPCLPSAHIPSKPLQ
ncbi:hypothetical protein K438DRAFT_1765838 [Mycena galopus ATCC 62051]|nr:hypothetical protein K438DRAFT_1765838 [Mycena galopus ATCC 62051]